MSLPYSCFFPMEMMCQYLIAPHLQPIKPGVTDLIGAILITTGLILPPVGELCQMNCKDEGKAKEYGYSELTPLSKE